MERTYTVYVYPMHACIYIHARRATPMNTSPMRARRTHAPTCCVRVRARVRMCDWARTHPRRHIQAPSAGVDRGWPRRAGVPVGVGVQCQHRRVEHRVGHRVVPGMRRSWPGGAHYGGRAWPFIDAARPVVRGGTADARARAHTCRHSLARGHGCRYGRAEGRLGTCIRIYV